jgi:hypothetical protein
MTMTHTILLLPVSDSLVVQWMSAQIQQHRASEADHQAQERDDEEFWSAEEPGRLRQEGRRTHRVGAPAYPTNFLA